MDSKTPSTAPGSIKIFVMINARKNGSYIPKSTLFNAFSRILKKSDLAPLPIHSLRHTHAVLLLEAGMDLKYIQERLGHGSIQITADVYSHISKKIQKDKMKKFEDYTKNILD
uniref:tyrosine-type recombinase/integrase n=1 Tax=Salipaludibacillus agaradhaerens TaxID=76935 RepID=UPI001FE8640F